MFLGKSLDNSGISGTSEDPQRGFVLAGGRDGEREEVERRERGFWVWKMEAQMGKHLS